MKLWIFEPSKHWDYCGGMAVAVADTFSDAAELLVAHEKARDEDIPEFYSSEDCVPVARQKEGWVVWINTHTFDVSERELPRAVSVNYNYA